MFLSGNTDIIFENTIMKITAIFAIHFYKISGSLKLGCKRIHAKCVKLCLFTFLRNQSVSVNF